MTPSDKNTLNMAMALLIEAHDLLAKSKLDGEQYNPISYRLNQAKLLVGDLSNKGG